MGRCATATPVAAFILAALLLLTGCVGQVSLDAEEEVSPGAAIGFTSINYVSLHVVAGDVIQDVLEIDANGRSVLVNNSMRQPFRFLPADKLVELRRNFAESNFFFWADSNYTTGDPIFRRQSIVFQADGQQSELRRDNEAPVPPEIEVLMTQLEQFVIEGVFGGGVPLAVDPIFAGESTRIENQQFVVVRNQGALLDLLFRVGSIEISVLPRIDYEREMLACVFLGADSDTTLSLSPVEASRHGDRVQFLYERRDVSSECDIDARPYLLTKLPRVDIPVEFFEAGIRDTTRCERD